MTADRMRIAIVAGEESGDILAADLVSALAKESGKAIELSGVGGSHLQALGLETLFDPGEISLMGISAVLARLPQLFRRISATADAVVESNPDCLITVDVPDFSLRVARKVRAADPSIPIIHYVCPSVWAWRPQRAADMRGFVDHVLCVLPFEVAELERLDGPSATYVGHRLTHDTGLSAAAERQKAAPPREPRAARTLLLLPGSRRSEVTKLLDPFRETVETLIARGMTLRLVIPTVPHVADMVREGTADWPVKPEIVLGKDARYEAFGQADAALAASGTVTLELALARVPTLSCYKTDAFGRLAYSMIHAWSASLPNLIADRPVIPEYYDHFVRAGTIARHLEQLAGDTSARAAQLDGFDAIAAAMATDRPSGEIAAHAALEAMRKHRG
ncbi:lipid-A-disaccharide synthase [Aquibium oceanicum]|uniref:Lipid-A-disaccharide synthase n=1 Tax=Aquibium oceanicum TaxID=1670800 RepID=A0A1L3ST36_9HYPH|nr:lipid-A-disaccharide synthase [Aquibium oceanicum]APH72472.1 lipid-A-disaccharide synthase [Aquibium oceanicum]